MDYTDGYGGIWLSTAQPSGLRGWGRGSFERWIGMARGGSKGSRFWRGVVKNEKKGGILDKKKNIIGQNGSKYGIICTIYDG